MHRTLIAASTLVLLAGPAWSCEWQSAAQNDLPAARVQLAQDQARPGRGPASETTVPSAAPPATPSNTTAATNQPPVVKQMNEEAANKVSKEGK